MQHLKKIIFVYCLFSSAYAFAHHGKGYKILSEQQIITAGVQGGIKALAPRSHAESDNPAKALTFSGDVAGYPNRENEIHAQHSLFITNRTAVTQRFEYKQTLTCAGRAIENKRWVEIESGGTFEDDTYTFLVMRQQESGFYPAKATTEISGLYNTYSEAYGSMTIK